MKIYGFVFARGGSKGVQGKNLRKLAGKSLLTHALDLLKELSEVSRIFVSTDCDTIASEARGENVEVINRPSSLATDDSPEWLSWQHAVEFVQARYGSFDTFLSVPTTAPLRTVTDVRLCLTAFEGVDSVLTVTKSSHHPEFNMGRYSDSGHFELCVGSPTVQRRQDSSQLYNISTVAYVTSPAFVLEKESFWNGRVGAVEIPQERALDIDTEFDLKVARLLIERMYGNDQNY